MNGLSQELPLSNGTEQPSSNMQQSSQGSSFNGGTSFEVIDHSPSSSTGNRTPQDLSYINPVGFGQISITDVTLEQALDKVQDLLKENKELRDYLKENNEMMRQQYKALSEWKEKINGSNKVNKEKFEETRRVILHLRDENSQLKEMIQAQEELQSATMNDKMKELESTAIRMSEEISVKDQTISQLQGQLQQLTVQNESVQSKSSETIYVAHSEDDDLKIQVLTEEKNKKAMALNEMTSQFQDLQKNIETVKLELQNSQKQRDKLQFENDRYVNENTELSSKIESLLSDLKSLKQENKKLKNSILELETKLDEQQKNAHIGGNVSTGTKVEDRWDVAASIQNMTPPDGSRTDRQTVPADAAVQMSYGKDHIAEIHKQLNQKDLQLEHVFGELRDKEQELYQLREAQNRHFQNTSELEKLGPKTTYILNTPSSDLHSLRSQNMSLMTEIKENHSKMESVKFNLDKKMSRIAELEEALQRTQEELKQRTEDSTMLQTLKMTLGNYEMALNAERKEHQNTKKQMVELRQAYNSLMTDYKSVLHGFESLKSQEQEKSHQANLDEEKKQLLSEISRLTAQILSAEESINYRDTQLQEIKKENEKLKEEVQTIPVLNAQADVWKADFDAERNAREAQHAENEKLKQDISNLRTQNQQLIDESHSYSKAQFLEMKRKHAPSGHQSLQQQLQSQLRVGGPTGPQAVYPPYQYPPQYPAMGPLESAGGQMLQPLVYPYQGSSVDPPVYRPQPQPHQQQTEEEYTPLSCPKCNLQCPDVDTLQIHVLECIEQ